MTNTKFEIILGMLFLKISNADVSFGEKILMWKSHTTNKALPITKQIQIVNPKEFVIAALDINNEMFVMYVAIRKREKMPVHSKRQLKLGPYYLTRLLLRSRQNILTIVITFQQKTQQTSRKYQNK